MSKSTGPVDKSSQKWWPGLKNNSDFVFGQNMLLAMYPLSADLNSKTK